MPPRLSIQIPSRNRATQLARCLDSLSGQCSDTEVLVGLDGGSDEEAHTLRSRWQAVFPAGFEAFPLPARGVPATRAELLNRASAPVTLALNDDVIAHPALIESHLDAHHACDTPLLVTGPSHFADIEDPNAFDEIVLHTDLIFFDVGSAARQGALGFRHCWTLNLSFPTELARSAGGFTASNEPYGHEDLELAYRLALAGAQIQYAEHARVTHDHRLSPIDVMRREYLLGRASYAFACMSPEFSYALHSRDLTSGRVLRFAAAFLGEHRRDAERVERTFMSWSDSPPTEQPSTTMLREAIVQHWLPLKRYLWYWGLHDAANGNLPRFAPLADTPPLP